MVSTIKTKKLMKKNNTKSSNCFNKVDSFIHRLSFILLPRYSFTFLFDYSMKFVLHSIPKNLYKLQVEVYEVQQSYLTK